jgi:CRISPR-associated endonuclease/helicase Cas3
VTEVRHYAHSLKDRPLKEWHDLSIYLTDTATRAAEFARAFGSDWARLAGLWHDAGKYQRRFQQRIGVDENAHTNESVDHSSVGALMALNRGADPLSFVVAGHHGGLQISRT